MLDVIGAGTGIQDQHEQQQQESKAAQHDSKEVSITVDSQVGMRAARNTIAVDFPKTFNESQRPGARQNVVSEMETLPGMKKVRAL